MFRLAGRIVDVYDDVKMQVLQENLAKIGSLEFAPVDEVMKLPHDKFALVFLTKTGRAVPKYPVHTADATALSTLYFEKLGHRLPAEAQRVAAAFLKKAAEQFKLPAPKGLEKLSGAEVTSNVVDVRKLSEETPKEAAPQHFALGTSYVIDTPAQVKTACAYFEEHVGNLAPRDRREFAKNAAARAGELKVKVPSGAMLHKYAGEGFGSLVDSARLERSALLAGDRDALKALEHLFEKRSSWKPEEFAAQLEKFDLANHLDRYWGRHNGVRDAYRSTFEGIKTAGVVKVGGRTVTHAQIHALAGSEKLKANFTPDFCAEYAKDPVAVFNSMPAPEKTVLASLAEGL
ncbi:MAG: hypothetical protein ABFE07_29630 [Armatimonadia bacterium]